MIAGTNRTERPHRVNVTKPAAGASLDVNIDSLISSQITVKVEAGVRVPTIPAVHSDLKPAIIPR